VKYIFYENGRYFSLLFGENGLDIGVHFNNRNLSIALRNLKLEIDEK